MKRKIFIIFIIIVLILIVFGAAFILFLNKRENENQFVQDEGIEEYNNIDDSNEVEESTIITQEEENKERNIEEKKEETVQTSNQETKQTAKQESTQPTKQESSKTTIQESTQATKQQTTTQTTNQETKQDNKQETTQKQETTEKEKSIYDYEFDIDKIRSELISIGKSKGLTHITEDEGVRRTPNNSSWAEPITGSKNFQGKNLERTLKDYVSFMADLVKTGVGVEVEYFTIYIQNNGNGSYTFYFLY